MPGTLPAPSYASRVWFALRTALTQVGAAHRHHRQDEGDEQRALLRSGRLHGETLHGARGQPDPGRGDGGQPEESLLVVEVEHGDRPASGGEQEAGIDVKPEEPALPGQPGAPGPTDPTG